VLANCRRSCWYQLTFEAGSAAHRVTKKPFLERVTIGAKMAFMKKMKDGFNKLVGTPMDAQVNNSEPINSSNHSVNLNKPTARISTDPACKYFS
jgi:hypothetical protein